MGLGYEQRPLEVGGTLRNKRIKGSGGMFSELFSLPLTVRGTMLSKQFSKRMVGFSKPILKRSTLGMSRKDGPPTWAFACAM